MSIFDKIFGTHDAPPTNPALTYETEGPVTANLTVIHGDVHIHSHDAPTILVTFTEVRGDSALAPEGPGWGFDLASGVFRIDAYEMPSRELKLSGIDVFLPVDSSVTLNATGGDCTMVGRFASVQITTTGGDVDTSAAIAQRCHIHSAGGDIEAVIAGEGDVRTAGGDIELSITAQSTVSAHTAGGDISIDVHAPCVITANTMAGDIEVTVDRGYETEVDASTTVGEISSDIAFHVSGDTGEPAAVRLTLTTTAGDIEIKQR